MCWNALCWNECFPYTVHISTVHWRVIWYCPHSCMKSSSTHSCMSSVQLSPCPDTVLLSQLVFFASRFRSWFEALTPLYCSAQCTLYRQYSKKLRADKTSLLCSRVHSTLEAVQSVTCESNLSRRGRVCHSRGYKTQFADLNWIAWGLKTTSPGLRLNKTNHYNT